MRLVILQVLKDILGGVTAPTPAERLKSVLDLLQHTETHESIKYFKKQKSCLVNAPSFSSSLTLPLFFPLSLSLSLPPPSLTSFLPLSCFIPFFRFLFKPLPPHSSSHSCQLVIVYSYPIVLALL